MNIPLIIKKGLFSYSGVKGSYFIEDKTVRLLEKISSNLLKKLKARKIRCPLFLSSNLLKLQSQFKSFETECFKVENTDKYLKPTSELILLEKVKQDVFNGEQILRYYMDGSVFRRETKQNYPGIRHDEIMYFMEGHFFSESSYKVKKEFKRVERIYDSLFKSLGIVFFKTYRPDEDRFPGSIQTLAYNYITSTGKVLQIGTIHNLSTSFTRLLNLKKGDNELLYASYGISERLITAMIDNEGIENPLLYSEAKTKKEVFLLLKTQKVVYYAKEKMIYKESERFTGTRSSYVKLLGKILREEYPILLKIGTERFNNYISTKPVKDFIKLGFYEGKEYWAKSW
jgi:prolyl-tRNA synthetase